jgi:CRISPR-associated protein Cmr1
VRYLGYGAASAPGVKPADLPRYLSPFEFELELRIRTLADEQLNRAMLESLGEALRAIGIFGGIGKRSRRGLGSLVLTKLVSDGLSPWVRPGSLDDLAAEATHLLARAKTATELPSYTALSNLARIVLIPTTAQMPAPNLLDQIGKEMMRYRSWGPGGVVLGRTSEKNFLEDHELMRKPWQQRDTHPKRIVFGLPHNCKQDPVGPADDTLDRRASPLFIHLHEVTRGTVVVLSFLPSVFLPGGDAAKIGVGRACVRITPHPELWHPIRAFLDRFFAAKPPAGFGTAREVRP